MDRSVKDRIYGGAQQYPNAHRDGGNSYGSPPATLGFFLPSLNPIIHIPRSLFASAVREATNGGLTKLPDGYTNAWMTIMGRKMLYY